MIDSHCHLDFEAFDSDRAAVLVSAASRGVTELVIPGTQLASAKPLLQLCARHPQCYPALGLHPYFLADYQPDHLQQLDTMLTQHRQQVVAVGEIGIDAHIDIELELQLQAMEAQLQLAVKYDLPVIVHHRKSHHIVLGALSRARLRRGGVIHAFSGSLQDAERYIELGYKLGVGGVITYPRAQKTRATLAAVPLEALVLETDSPDMPLHGRQGQRNSPEYLPDVAQALAELRDTSTDTIMEQTAVNTRTVFSF